MVKSVNDPPIPAPVESDTTTTFPPGFDVFAWSWAKMNPDERSKLRHDGNTPNTVKEYIKIIEGLSEKIEATITAMNDVFFKGMQRRSVVQLTLSHLDIKHDVTRVRPVCSKCNGKGKWEKTHGYGNAYVRDVTCDKCEGSGHELEMDSYVLVKLDGAA